MIRKYPGQNIPPGTPEASNIPKLHWIEVLSNTLKVITSPPRQDAPKTTDYYYNTKFINDELTAIKNRLTALETRATNLETRVTRVEGRATNLETRATTVEGRATNLETGLATTNTNLATTNTNLATTNTNLATTSTKVGVIEGQINPPSITSSGSNRQGTVGGNFSYQITASNTPTSYGASGLPPGLSVNTTNGLLSGQFTIAGSYDVTVTATNLGGTGSKSFNITVY
jgi:uncharacterized coiled-coil protein SlyX